MEAYSSFAQVYDLFMDNVPYEEWSSYLMELLKEYGTEDGLVLELGCGTGKMGSVAFENLELQIPQYLELALYSVLNEIFLNFVNDMNRSKN